MFVQMFFTVSKPVSHCQKIFFNYHYLVLVIIVHTAVLLLFIQIFLADPSIYSPTQQHLAFKPKLDNESCNSLINAT